MKHLDLSVFEPGDMIGTLSRDGKVTIWTVNPDGTPVQSDNRLFGNTTGLTPESTLEDLDLTVRTYNCLKRERVNTVGELLAFYDAKGRDGLLDIRNFGEKGVDEVERWIKNLRAEESDADR